MNSAKRLNAGIYPRVSTQRQVEEGFSLEAQRENLSHFAKQQGWHIFGDYSDDGISAKNVKDRPGVKRLINDIKEGKIDVVVLYKFDRLTRDSRDTEDFIQLLQEYSYVMVYAISGGVVDVSTPTGRFNARIMGAVAQYERENTIDRVIDGFIKKVKDGYSLCSSVSSYGYNRPKHQAIQTVNIEEANIVKKIFNLYINGKTLTEICNMLNEDGIPTKKKGRIMKKRGCNEYYVINSVWQPKAIKNILSNPNYIGKVRYGCNREQVTLKDAQDYKNRKKGFWADGLHEAIIDIETWKSAQEKLKKTKHIRRTNISKEDAYYCGFLKCGYCGHLLTTNRTNRVYKSGKKRSFLGYRCINREKKLCPALGISHMKVEKTFMKYLGEVVLFDEIDISDVEKKTDDTKLIDLNRKSVQNKQKLKEIMDLFTKDLISFEEYKNMKNTLENEIEKNTYNIKQLKIENTPQNEKFDLNKISKNLKDHFQYLTSKEKRQFLVEFVKSIVIINEDDDKVNGLPKIIDVEFYND